MHNFWELCEEVFLLAAAQEEMVRWTFPKDEVGYRSRRVLHVLHTQGEMTIPDLGRSQSISRQHARETVMRLAKMSLVRLVPNPKHSRSRLVQITRTGKRCVRENNNEINKTAARLLAGKVSARQIGEATRVIRSLRETLGVFAIDK